MFDAIRTSRHFPALDGLRGLAILLVIPHNADVFQAGSFWLLGILAHLGWVGVQLFFVLSGFLITSNLIDSQGAPNYYKAFFARRILRIFPLYYGVLIGVFLILPQFMSLPASVAASQNHQIWLWTFLVNWTEPFGGSVEGFSHFWSLAIEEQFYLLWPWLVYKRSPRAILKLSAILIVAALAIRCALLLAEARPQVLYMFTVCRMDALAAGAAVAALVRMPEAAALLKKYAHCFWVFGIALGIGGAAVTHAYSVHGIGTFSVGYTVLSLCFAFLVLAGVARPERSNALYHAVLTLAPLRSIGKYSYGMYVFHMLIIVGAGTAILGWLKPLAPIFYPVAYALIIGVLSYVTAFISYHCYEKHFLKLKRRFAPASSPALQSVV